MIGILFALSQVSMSDAICLRDAILQSGRNLHQPPTSQMGGGGREMLEGFTKDKEVNQSLAMLLLGVESCGTTTRDARMEEVCGSGTIEVV